MRKWLPTQLVVLLMAFVALAILYSLIIPIFEGPDEDDHYRYARFIAEQRTLAVQLFQPGGGVAGHQGWQPPLYYSLAALVIAPIDTSDYEQHLWRNPAFTFVGDPACCGRNIYYHTDSENFPFTRTTLAVHLARLLSILFGAVTVAATYALVRTAIEACGEQRRTIAPTQAQSRPASASVQPAHVGFASLLPRLQSPDLLALAAAAFVAFNPSFLFSSALVSNDTALAAFSTLVLFVWAQVLTERRALNLKTAAWLGVLIGLGVLTKTTALGLVPISILVLGVVAWRKRDGRWAIGGNIVMLAMIVLIAGWWFVRNWTLYGDPFALRLVSTSALFPRAGPLTLPELFQISLPWLWQTFWGGPTPGDFSAVILVVLAVLSLLAMVGTMTFVLRPSSFACRSLLAFLAVWLAFIVVAQIQFIQTTVGADQGRYLFPAIGAIALFFVIGLREFGARIIRNSQFAICSFVIVFSFLLAIFVPFAYTLPAYAHPALMSSDDLARVAHPLQTNFADQIELRGYDLDTRSVKPGETLHVTLSWRALAQMPVSYRVFVHLVGQNDRSGGGADVIPARGAFPTVYWKPGDALRDVVEIPIAANAVPGKYVIEVGLYPVGKPGERLPVFGADDDRVVIDAIKIAPRENVAAQPQTRIAANFGNAQLVGYDANRDANALMLTLYWQCLAPIERDYTVFVHVLDANGVRIAQTDQLPQAGNNPTSLWLTGENVRDDYSWILPANVSASAIEVGMYSAETGERLSVTDARGTTTDHLRLDLRP